MCTSVIASESATGADIDLRVYLENGEIRISFGLRDDPEPAVITLGEGAAYDVGMALLDLSE